MSVEIPNTEPVELRIGTSWDWNKTLGDFPASAGWQLTYYLRCKVAASSDLTLAWGTKVTASGDEFQVRVDPADSASLTAGAYELIGVVTDGSDTYTPIVKRLVVLPAATASGTKSHAQTMLDAIQARMQGRSLTQEQRRIQINSRSIEYADDAELRKSYAYWQYIVQLEENPNARLKHHGRFVNA